MTRGRSVAIIRYAFCVEFRAVGVRIDLSRGGFVDPAHCAGLGHRRPGDDDPPRPFESAHRQRRDALQIRSVDERGPFGQCDFAGIVVEFKQCMLKARCLLIRTIGIDGLHGWTHHIYRVRKGRH